MRTVLTADRLIDGTGRPPVAHAALVIEDGRIAGIATGDEVGAALEGADRVDVSGGSILPGFVEMHTHMHCSAEVDPLADLATDSHEAMLLRSARAMRLTLGSGVTTSRDLGSRNEIAFAVKQAVEDGIIPGPHMLVAGTPITTTGGHCHMFGTEANSVEQVRQAVRGQVKLGADWIKIMATGGRFTPRTNPRQPQFPVDTLRAAVDDAARLGVSVAAHCHATAGVRNAVEAGVKNLIHAMFLSADPDAGFDYDPAVADQIAEKGLFVDPTVATLHLRNSRTPGAGDQAGPFGSLDDRYEILSDMRERGVRFVSGLDSGMNEVHFDDFAWIPQLMVERVGMSPMEAIVSSTSTSAECLGVLDETGTLEPGKRADAIIVNGDPSADIKTLHDVDTVVKAGQIVKRGGAMTL
jgi:imidazolonepropionase-like amidohydrolase